MASALTGGEDGFTLVEVLVTLVILAVLAAVSIPSFSGYIDKSKEKAYMSEARLVGEAVQVYVTEEYAKGTLDEVRLVEDLMLYELGEKENALSGILKGSYTKGAKIKSANISYEDAALESMTYQVDGHEITLDFRDGK